MEHDSQARTRRTRATVGVVGVAGIIGGLVAGAGMFAGAATTGPTYSPTASQCANPSAPVPAVPAYAARFVVGGGKLAGVIPAITPASLAARGITGIVPTLVNVSVTTQYNSGRSGAGKIDIATVTLPGHQFTNPLLFNIPPVTNTETVGLGPVPFAAQTTGRAFATVSVTESIAQATSLTPQVVLGDTCPVGTTKVGYLQGANFAPPSAPTAVTATSGATTTGSANGNSRYATVKFVPSAANGPVVAYEILPIDLTNPTAVQQVREDGDVPAAGSNAVQTVTVGGLTPGDSYEFQVFAISNLEVAGAPSAATSPAVTPGPLTVGAASITANSKVK